MPLTPAQKLTLRTAIQANATTLAFGAGTAQINTVFGGSNLNAGDAQYPTFSSGKICRWIRFSTSSPWRA